MEDVLDGDACKMRYYSLTAIVRLFAVSAQGWLSEWRANAICRN
jgi:hypothetical protein